MNRERRFPWEVKIEDLYRKDNCGDIDYTPTGVKGVFRTDNNYCMGAVTPTYKNITNESIENIVYDFEDTGCEYVSHGEWQDGKMIWVQLKSSEIADTCIGTNKEQEDQRDDYARTPDMVKNTILIASGHAGKLPFTVRGTTIRVVCWNTFIAAMRGEAAINIRHKGDAQERVYAYSEQVAEIGKAHRELMYNFNRMKRAPASMEQITKFGYSVLDIDPNVPQDSLHGRTVKRIDGMMDQLDDVAGMNAWGAFNMITGYVDHVQNAKTDVGKDDYGFSYNSLLNSRIKQQAYNRMMAYTEKYEEVANAV